MMKVLSEKELKSLLAEKIAQKNLLVSTSDGSPERVLSNSPEQVLSENQEAQEQDSEKSIKNYLLKTLTRREYSAAELRAKCLQKNFNPALAESVLQQLIEESFQSDQRFCEMFIRSHIAKHSGPFKIRRELIAKGLSTSVINKGCAEIESDWFALALEAAQKKTHSWKSFEFEDKAKLMRFLQGKGFEQEQIRYAADTLWLRQAQPPQ